MASRELVGARPQHHQSHLALSLRCVLRLHTLAAVGQSAHPTQRFVLQLSNRPERCHKVAPTKFQRLGARLMAPRRPLRRRACMPPCSRSTRHSLARSSCTAVSAPCRLCIKIRTEHISVRVSISEKMLRVKQSHNSSRRKLNILHSSYQAVLPPPVASLQGLAACRGNGRTLP